MSISIKEGKIILTENDKEVEIDKEYIIIDIKKAIKATNRESLYVRQAREVSKLITSNIDEAKKELARLLGIEHKEGFTMGGKSPVPSASTPLAKCNIETAKQVFGIKIGKSGKVNKAIALDNPSNAKLNFKRWHDWVGMLKQFGNKKSSESSENTNL